MSKVSIIVPVYKVEKYLEKCVRSIQEQSFSNLEIILVDDGSPDCCGELCDMFAKKDSRICVIHKENGGLSDARNVGVRKATGEYLLFVDSDDWIDKKLVEKLIQVADKKKADIVMFDYVSVDEKMNVNNCFSMPFEAGVVLSAKTEPRIICKSCSACNKMFRKEFWNKNNLCFPVGKHYEDLGTIPKVLCLANSIVYLNEVLYYYVQREGSIMHGDDFKKNYDDRTEMLDNILDFYEEKGVSGKYKNELEWLIFENGYFIPSKEIVLSNWRSPYLKKFRTYAENKFPNMHYNPYIQEMTKKDRILYKLLKNRLYIIMIILSKCRHALNL